MKYFKKMNLARVILIFIGVFLSAGVFSTQYGGTLNIAVPADVAETIDPHKATGALTFEILYNIYEALNDVDTFGNIVPRLAHSWEISKDGMVFTFFLKKGVKFHNGKEFTSKDAEYSFKRILDDETKYSKKSNYTVIEEISLPDEYTIRFTLSKPYAPFLALVSKIYIVPEGSGNELDKTAIGTGPFTLKEWARDRYMMLERFAQYHEEGLPYLDRAYFRVIPDVNTQVLSLKTGDVDVIPHLEPSFVETISKRNDLTFIRAPMNLVQILAINNEREPFNDIRVRQAVNYAIDRNILIELVSEGFAKPLSAHLPPESPYYVDLSGVYPYSREKAQQLLKEAGFPDGLEVTIALPQPYLFHQRTGEVIAQMLEEAGFKTNLVIVEWGKWISDIYYGREYDMTIIGHQGEPDPYLMIDRFYSYSTRNYLNVKNEELDRLIDLSVSTVDFTQRKEIVGKILTFLVEEAAAYWTLEPDEIVAINKKVNDWEIYPVYVDALKKVWIKQ